LRALRLNSPAAWLLLAWAVLVGFALHAGPYGLTEEGSKALLLAWSIADQVPSTAITLGAPDIRLIFFLPLAFLWSGQVIAAKLLTLLVMAAAGVLLYSWRRHDQQCQPRCSRPACCCSRR
jgi:4-hydroxybenzoate polyprenyltransferase